MCFKLKPVILKLLIFVLAVFPFYPAFGNGEVTNATNIYLPVIWGPDVWSSIDPSGQIIIFWHQYSRERETAVQEISDEFNAANPWEIIVIPVYQGGYGDIFFKMLTVLNTPEAPNLVVAYQNQAAIYQQTSALTDMTSLVESTTWGLNVQDRTDFFDGFYNQDIFPTYGNARLGFPPNRSIETMYYNADWLTELGYAGAPTNPDAFEEIACAAAANPFSGAVAEGSRGYELSIDASCFASWTFAFGGDVFDYEINQYNYNNESAIAAMTFIQRLFNEGCATRVNEHDGDQTNFSQGTTLFTVGASYGFPYYQSAVEEGANFGWSVAALPHTTEQPVMNIYGASISIPQHEPEAQLAAWLFLKYFTSPDVQAEWVQASDYFPVRGSVAEKLQEAGYFDENPIYETAFGLLRYGIAEPSVPGYEFVREMVKDAMTAIAEGADVQSTLDQLNEDANNNLTEQVAP